MTHSPSEARGHPARCRCAPLSSTVSITLLPALMCSSCRFSPRTKKVDRPSASAADSAAPKPPRRWLVSFTSAPSALPRAALVPASAGCSSSSASSSAFSAASSSSSLSPWCAGRFSAVRAMALGGGACESRKSAFAVPGRSKVGLAGVELSVGGPTSSSGGPPSGPGGEKFAGPCCGDNMSRLDSIAVAPRRIDAATWAPNSPATHSCSGVMPVRFGVRKSTSSAIRRTRMASCTSRALRLISAAKRVTPRISGSTIAVAAALQSSWLDAAM
mmetsp:Transcript_27650/g.85681  ORF Transcript_27650/g.85681 Transcript_27650/m.85681 type:complete len:273 (-) Transcript_27650:708-1526(-)